MKVFIVDNENKVDRYALYFKEFLDQEDVTICEKPATATSLIKADTFDICVINVASVGVHALDDFLPLLAPFTSVILTNYKPEKSRLKTILKNHLTVILLDDNSQYGSLISVINALMKDSYDLSLSKRLRQKFIYVKQGHQYLSIPLLDVDYLHSVGNYTSLIYGQNKVLIKKSLTKLMQLPKFKHFIRTQRNYAVNKFNIKSIDFNHKILHIDSINIPIGRTYVKDLRNYLSVQLLK